jgi:precorrin-3B synthase
LLSARQLRVLSAASIDLGDGQLELTSRANIQLRGLAAGAEVELADRLADAGLLPSRSHETVRNIIASPLTGWDDNGLLDVRPLVSELDRALCSDPALADLPGRFLFILDDGRGDVAALNGDVALLPLDTGEVALLLASADSGLRFLGASGVEAMIAAAHAFLAERTLQGSGAWRLSELDQGADRVASRVVDWAHAAGRPFGRAFAHDPQDGAVLGGNVPDIDVLGSDRTNGHGLELSVPERGPVGLIERPAGRIALAAVIPLARLTIEQAGLVAAAAEVGSGELRLTPWRGVIVDLSMEQAGNWFGIWESAGLAVAESAPWVGVTACTGQPGCAKSLTDVRSDATLSLPTVARSDAIPVHWSGCARRCGRPQGAVIDVVATSDCYEIRNGDQLCQRVPNGANLGEVATAIQAARANR